MGEASGDSKGEFSFEIMISTNHQMPGQIRYLVVPRFFFLLVTLPTGEYVSASANT